MLPVPGLYGLTSKPQARLHAAMFAAVDSMFAGVGSLFAANLRSRGLDAKGGCGAKGRGGLSLWETRERDKARCAT